MRKEYLLHSKYADHIGIDKNIDIGLLHQENLGNQLGALKKTL